MQVSLGVQPLCGGLAAAAIMLRTLPLCNQAALAPGPASQQVQWQRAQVTQTAVKRWLSSNTPKMLRMLLPCKKRTSEAAPGPACWQMHCRGSAWLGSSIKNNCCGRC